MSAPAVVLTDAEREALAWGAGLTPTNPTHGLAMTGLTAAVERIVAVRLAAVDGLLQKWRLEAGPNPKFSNTLAADLASILSPTAPDDGGDCQDSCTTHSTCRAPAEAVTETAQVVRGWRYYLDGSQSPVERWVKHADGDWVSLDSTRRTTGDILMEV